MTSSSSTLRTAAGIAVAVMFLWLAFGRVDWNTMTAVHTSSPGYI